MTFIDGSRMDFTFFYLVSMETAVEVNARKSKYMVASRDKHGEGNHDKT